MRSIGLPARVATGYALQESSRQGGSALLISDRDAHAWPEVFFQESGWVIADVTPQRVLDPPPKPPDPDLQRLLGELARGENPLPTDQPPTIPTIMAAARKAGVTLQRVFLWASVCLLLTLFAIKWWRRLIPIFVRDRTLARVLYRAVLDQMSEVNWIRERGESREAFAMKLADACPTFRNLTALHVGAAFGSTRSLDSEELRGLGRSVKKELRQTVPGWRWVLGIVSPWGWLRTR